MVNGLHLYSAFIQRHCTIYASHSPIHTHIHTHIHTPTAIGCHARYQPARQEQFWGLDVLLKDTSTRPGWDRNGNPPTARRQLLPPEPYRLNNQTKYQTNQNQKQRVVLENFSIDWLTNNRDRIKTG